MATKYPIILLNNFMTGQWLSVMLMRKTSQMFSSPGLCRLGSEDSNGPSMSGLFICAVCQVDLAASEGISVHAGAIFSTSSKPWQGPFLCADCRNKKDAMEGKRPSGVKVA